MQDVARNGGEHPQVIIQFVERERQVVPWVAVVPGPSTRYTHPRCGSWCDWAPACTFRLGCNAIISKGMPLWGKCRRILILVYCRGMALRGVFWGIPCRIVHLRGIARRLYFGTKAFW